MVIRKPLVFVGGEVVELPVEDTADQVGIPGEKGDTGEQGPKGDTGAGIQILGSKDDPSELPTEDNTVGDAYLIDGRLWMWDGDGWNDTGSIQGPAGEKGDDGQSAYEVAVSLGFEGTLSEWLESLKGADGTDGAVGDEGPQGIQGEVGPEGPQGEKGDRGDTGPAGPGSGDMLKSENLADLTDYTAARSNLGLGNVDDTSDEDKPVSTAQATAIGLKANIDSPTFTGTVGGITAAMVGLDNVNNTSDAAKPVSTAAQTALDLKAPLANPTFTGTVAGVTKTHVGLGNVDNTSDADKPVSTAQQTALNLKANLASPTLSGTPTAPTAATSTNTTQLATTAFVQSEKEYLASLSQSLHFGAIVANLIYDTSKDSDGGAWRKRCADKSWYTETLGGVAWLGQAGTAAGAWALPGAVTGSYFQNTTDGKFYTLGASSPTVAECFRGNVREFPAVAGIVAEASRVVIYDLTQPGCPMWMVFRGVYSSNAKMIATSSFISSVAALNGQMAVSATGAFGVSVVSFLSDGSTVYRSTAHQKFNGNIASRDAELGLSVTGLTASIVNSAVNSVAITVLDNAPTDPATGLPVPTIVVGTQGGASVLKQDGTVVNSAHIQPMTNIRFAQYGGLWWSHSSGGDVFYAPNPLASSFASPYDFYELTIPSLPNGNDVSNKLSPASNGVDAFGSAGKGIALFKNNPSALTKGMTAGITVGYSTGWMVGDIRGAWLADTVPGVITSANPQADRSVKNNPLQVVGTLTKTAVAAGAGLVAYSGFSASNYLEQAYNANLDFGTGDFCLMGWVDRATASAGTIFDRTTPGGGRLSVFVNSFGDLAVSVSSTGGGVSTSTQVALGLHFLCISRASGILQVFMDGHVVYSGANTQNITNNAAPSVFGVDYEHGAPWSGSMALWRIGATAPSADQIAEIYRTELPLFQSGAQCTLAGTSNAITALTYDEDTNIYSAGTSWGRTDFQGLTRVSSEATTVGSITSLSASGGAILSGGTSAKYYQPAILLRDELKRKAEAHLAFGKVPEFFDVDGVSGQTAYLVPMGFKVKAVYSAGLLKRIGSTKDYTVGSDGYRQTVNFAVSPGADAWVSLMCVRGSV